jgi:hypothetical protein
VDNAVAVVPNAAEWSGWLVFRRLAARRQPWRSPLAR